MAAPNIVVVFFLEVVIFIKSDIYKAKTGLTQNIMTLMSALSYKFNNILHNTIQEGKKKYFNKKGTQNGIVKAKIFHQNIK